MTEPPEPPGMLRLTGRAVMALDRVVYAEAVSPSDVVCRAIELYAALGEAHRGQVIEIATADGIWQRIVVLGKPGERLHVTWPWRRRKSNG